MRTITEGPAISYLPAGAAHGRLGLGVMGANGVRLGLHVADHGREHVVVEGV
jgi:hypothetical protein